MIAYIRSSSKLLQSQFWILSYIIIFLTILTFSFLFAWLSIIWESVKDGHQHREKMHISQFFFDNIIIGNSRIQPSCNYCFDCTGAKNCTKILRNHLHKAGFEKKLDQWIRQELMSNNPMDRIPFCDSILNRNNIDFFYYLLRQLQAKGVVFDERSAGEKVGQVRIGGQECYVDEL